MIIIDTNLLIYAVNVDSPDHTTAKRWLENLLSDVTTVALPWVVVMAFVRLTTRKGILESPISTESAIAYVNEWLHQPYVDLLHPTSRHWSIFSQLILASGARGNLTTDVHIAALAIEHGASVYSADYDFRRFSGVKHVNPLETNVIHDH